MHFIRTSKIIHENPMHSYVHLMPIANEYKCKILTYSDNIPIIVQLTPQYYTYILYDLNTT